MPEERIVPIAGHMGLLSLHERAQMAGGWMRVESAPGQGTTIEFWVPSLETQPVAAGN